METTKDTGKVSKVKKEILNLRQTGGRANTADTERQGSRKRGDTDKPTESKGKT